MRWPSTLIVLTAIFSLAACDEPAAPDPEVGAATDAAPVLETPVVMPDDAPPQEEVEEIEAEAAGLSCEADVGRTAAARLVARCLAVSPATRPPCHAANPCALIQDEIERACALHAPGEARPPECSA